MDIGKVAVCRTCLGPLDFPRNLCDENYKYLLELLHRLLNFQVNILGGVFNICRTCEGKLVWVSEFKDLCEKSCQKFKNNDCKEEFVDAINDYGLDNNDVDKEDDDYDTPEDSGSDSDYAPAPKVKKRKKEKEKHIDYSEHATNKKTKAAKVKSEQKWKFYRIEQFPESEVLQAISDYESKFMAEKFRTCIICHFVSASTAALRTHMSYKHKEAFPTWCRYCNEETIDLDMHKETTRCHEQQCKFCKKISPSRKNFPLHLRSHCNKAFNPDKADTFTREQVNSDPVNDYYQENDNNKHLNDIDKHEDPTADIDISDLISNNGSDSEDEDDEDIKERDNSDDEYHVNTRNKNNLDQYSEEQVLQAIELCRSYLTNYRFCLHCNLENESFNALANHMTRNHPELAKNWCYRCNVQTIDLESHKEQVQCRKNQCQFCQKQFIHTAHLKRHLQEHCLKAFPNVYDDDVVNRRLKQVPKSEVLKALKEFEKTKIKSTDCIYCDFVGSDAKHLRGHLTRKHEESYDSWCKNCNIHTDDLLTHQTEAKCNEQFCKFCNRSYSSKKNFPLHLKAHCLKLKGKTLPDAKWKAVKQFPKDDVLQAITASSLYMSDSKTRTCHHCEYIGITNRTLAAHMTFRHPTLAESWCSRCNLQCDGKEQLYSHKITVKCCDNQCNLCGKSFKRSPHLLRHLELHCHEMFKNSNEKAFENNDVDWESILLDETDKVDISVKSDIDDTSKEDYQSNLLKCQTSFGWDSPVSSEKESESSDSDDDKILATRTRQKGRIKQFTKQDVQKVLTESIKLFYTNRKCLICGHLASNSKELATHLSKHKNALDKWCSLCNTLCKNLRKHIDNHKIDALRCKLCKKSFEGMGDLKRHIIQHCSTCSFDLTPTWFSCDKCPISFPNEWQMKKHKCFKNDIQTFCLICKKKVRNIRAHNLTKHKPLKIKTKAMPGSSDKLCTVCGKIFKNNQNLTVHMRKHTGERPYKCNYCERQFPNRPYLREHERRHTGEKPYVCHICGRRFVSNGDHKQHMQIHEGGPVQCTICNKEFSRPGVLALHMKRHTGENPYACLECGISYHRPSLLKNHMRSHSNERPFKCSFCDKYFSCKSTLKKHEHVHKGIKPYKCSVCSFSCTQAHGLSSHMKQHPEDPPQPDRPYKCLFCHRQFDTNAMLMSHTNNQHREQAGR